MTEAARHFDVRAEAAPDYSKYIERVPEGGIVQILERQEKELLAFFGTLSEERSRFRYAPEKWSVRQVMSHIIDSERVFAFRAFWFARGFDSPLPSFDQDVSERHAEADRRTWKSLVTEFQHARASTLDVFRELPPEAWLRRGIASDNLFTVRALAFIIAGHAIHHAEIVKQRYLQP
jgi:hypothetical protein